MALYEINPNNMRGSGSFFLARAGEALGRVNLVYKGANGAWFLADADAAATMPTLGITMGRARVAGQIVRILDKGFIGRSTWTWTTGGEIYASTVAGELTQVAPAGPGDVVQIVAMATSPRMIKFSSDIGNRGTGMGGGDPDFFAAPNPDSFIGQHAAVGMLDGVDVTVRMDFLLPSDFDISTWSVDVLLVPGGTGNLRRGVVTDFGVICDSEDFDENEDSIAAGQVAVTANEIECLDITAALTGSTALDLVGMEFTRYGSNVNDTVGATCYFIGVVIRRP